MTRQQKLEALLGPIRERADKAHREICDVASGKRQWEMCVPVQPTDSDMTLQASLDDLARLAKIVEAAGELAEAVVNMSKAVNHHWDGESRDVYCEEFKESGLKDTLAAFDKALEEK